MERCHTISARRSSLSSSCRLRTHSITASTANIKPPTHPHTSPISFHLGPLPSVGIGSSVGSPVRSSEKSLNPSGVLLASSDSTPGCDLNFTVSRYGANPSSCLNAMMVSNMPFALEYATRNERERRCTCREIGLLFCAEFRTSYEHVTSARSTLTEKIWRSRSSDAVTSRYPRIVSVIFSRSCLPSMHASSSVSCIPMFHVVTWSCESSRMFANSDPGSTLNARFAELTPSKTPSSVARRPVPFSRLNPSSSSSFPVITCMPSADVCNSTTPSSLTPSRAEVSSSRRCPTPSSFKLTSAPMMRRCERWKREILLEPPPDVDAHS
mmetsp:Transcript_72103/g.150641  ORF Transcript_72103/g.150641 Transcript_72103/m.150641 type:complete len:325 (-) Transcript_72103:2821-3795(-)